MISVLGDAHMAQLVVRNLDSETKEKLRSLAAARGHSLEQEVRDILRRAVESRGERSEAGLGTRISQLFAGSGFSGEFPEFKGQVARPVEFEE